MGLIIQEALPKGMPLFSRSMLHMVAIIVPLLETMPMISTRPLSSSSSWEKNDQDQSSIPLSYCLQKLICFKSCNSANILLTKSEFIETAFNFSIQSRIITPLTHFLMTLYYLITQTG